ncbi:MAG: PP2C family protein-serine/threonine phosphatase [Polyangia bacterium]
MSEQRLSVLIASGGILCLLIQLVVSLTDNPTRRAQQVAQEVAFKSVQHRAHRRAVQLGVRLGKPVAEQDLLRMQADVELAAEADPEIVEAGLVDRDLTVLACSDKARARKPLGGPAEALVRRSVAEGYGEKDERSEGQQRVMLVIPVDGKEPKQALLYMILTTHDTEEALSKVVAAMRPPSVPAWLTIGLGLLGLGAALGMLLASERRQSLQALRVQEVIEQMASGHFEARLDPLDVPYYGGIAERLNTMAEQVQNLAFEHHAAHERVLHLDQELQDAQVVQKTLMPEVRQIPRGALQLCGMYRSAAQVSGDWWTYYPLDEHRTLLVLADVVGHGIGSSVVGAMAYGCAMQLYQDLGAQLRPEFLLSRLNQAIWSTTKGKFTMSCFAVIIDTKDNQLTFASGAHAFPLLFRARDQQKPVIPLVAAGSPLGSSGESKFAASTQPFEPGDVLICFTDGLIEAQNTQGDQFGDKRVRQTVQRVANRDVDEISRSLLGEHSRFVGTDELEDDLTLVVARHGSATNSKPGA